MFGFEFLERFAFLGDDGFEGFFQVFFGAGGGITAAGTQGDGKLGEEAVSGVEVVIADDGDIR